MRQLMLLARKLTAVVPQEIHPMFQPHLVSLPSEMTVGGVITMRSLGRMQLGIALIYLELQARLATIITNRPHQGQEAMPLRLSKLCR